MLKQNIVWGERIKAIFCIWKNESSAPFIPLFFTATLEILAAEIR